MILDITANFKNSDERTVFDYQADLYNLTLTYGERPVVQPVRVCGAVFSAHGAVILELMTSGVLQLQCDRCGKPLAQTFSTTFSAMVSSDADAQESEKLIVAEGSRLDLDELAQTAILLSLPGKHLCDQACKGLCPRCGADLNLGACSCDRHHTDLA